MSYGKFTTPAKNARGLGSAKSGTEHHIRQRVSAIALIFLVLGSIIAGVATVNQAGAIGAIGAMIMAGYRLSDGEKGKYTPAILAVLALLAIALVVSFHEINIKRIDTSADLIGLIVALIAVSLLLLAIFWSGWRTLKIQDTLKGVMLETAKTSSLVFIILLGAAVLSFVLACFEEGEGEPPSHTFAPGSQRQNGAQSDGRRGPRAPERGARRRRCVDTRW
mgnify:CR=1 FL=1